MNTLQIKENLIKAFGVETLEDLKKYLPGTDLSSGEEVLHAAADLLYCRTRYGVYDRRFLHEIIDSESNESRYFLEVNDFKTETTWKEIYIKQI